RGWLPRNAMRMFIWERTAPCPMTFWVGRWVAAMRVTAGARPSRAIVSVWLIASGTSSASSAYSSMMITRADRAGEGLPLALAVVGEVLSAGEQDGDRVGQQRGGFGRGGGEAVDA